MKHNLVSSLALLMSSLSLFQPSIAGEEHTIKSNWQPPETLYQLPEFVLPELAQSKPYKVGVRTMSITHQDQIDINNPTQTKDRNLTLEVWYPAEFNRKKYKTSYKNVTRLHYPFSIAAEAYRNVPVHSNGSFPLIVLSHGYTGYRTLVYYLGEHLAANGYIVVSIDHPDSTNAITDYINAPFAGFPSTLFNRARDQQFVLDYFSTHTHFLTEKIDSNNAGIIGYSMGGYGAINLVGSCYNFTSAALQQLGYTIEQAEQLIPLYNSCAAGKPDASSVDPRWKAMISLAPWGGELGLFNMNDVSNITVPSLFIVGDQDEVAGYEYGVKPLYDAMTTPDKYMLVYQNVRHNVAPHPAPSKAKTNIEDYSHYHEAAWDNEILNANNKHFSLAFLNCHLKKQENSCSYLELRRHSNAPREIGNDPTDPWKGFSARYSTGMQWFTPNN